MALRTKNRPVFPGVSNCHDRKTFTLLIVIELPGHQIYPQLHSRRRIEAALPSSHGGDARQGGGVVDGPGFAAAPDPKAEERAAAARERNRAEREASVERGLDELDIWVADQAERGLATFATGSTQACRLIAQRLVDAKAAGLASQVEGLPARLFAEPEADRPQVTIRELGQVHLIAEAYCGREALAPGLRADAEFAVGWSRTRKALLDDPHALRVEARWRVVGTLSEVQPDRLRRVETWLWSEDAAPPFAALFDFVPVATGAAAGGYVLGDRVEASLVFYPSAQPLRAQVEWVTGGVASAPDPLRLPDTPLASAYHGYEAALAGLHGWVHGRLPLGRQRFAVLASGSFCATLLAVLRCPSRRRSRRWQDRSPGWGRLVGSGFGTATRSRSAGRRRRSAAGCTDDRG